MMLLLKVPPVFSTLISQIMGSILLCPPDTIDQTLPMMPPIPTSWKEFEKRKIINEVLNKCCQPNAGYEIQPTDEWIVNGGEFILNFVPPATNDDDNVVNYTKEGVESNKSTTGGDSDNDTSSSAIIARRFLTMPPISSKPKPSTYGEVTTTGARQLFHHMGMLSPNQKSSSKKEQQQQKDDNNNNNNEIISFMDMGSGAGKLVIQAVMEIQDLKRSIGIELAPSRHLAAINAKQRLVDIMFQQKQEQQEIAGRRLEAFLEVKKDVSASLQFYQDDILNADLTDITHIYIASLCFPKQLMTNLEAKLVQQQQQQQTEEGSTKHNKLQCIASIQKFPNLPYTKIECIEMSWTKPKGSKVYFYDMVPKG